MASQERKGKINIVHSMLYTNLCHLMCYVPPSSQLQQLISEDMFLHNNSNAKVFYEVLYYLLNIYNKEQCKDKFQFCWPIYNQKQKYQFLRAACTMIQEMKTNNPEANLPTITLAMFSQPGGDRFCATMLKISIFVITTLLQKDDTELLLLPASSTDSQAKTLITIKTERLLSKSVQHHSKTVAAVQKADQYAEICANKAMELVSEESKIRSELNQILTSLNVKEDLLKQITNPEDQAIMQKWKARLESKRERLLELLFQDTQRAAEVLQDCRQKAEIILSCNPSHVIDGNNLVPNFSDELLCKLGLSEKETKEKFFESHQLKLQGLLEMGSHALQILSLHWMQHDMTSSTDVLPRLQSLLFKAEKQTLTVSSAEQDLVQLNETMKPILTALVQRWLNMEATDTPASTSNVAPKASSLLLQVPFTPPFHFKEEEEGKDTKSCFSLKEISLPDNTCANLENLLRVWKGEMSFSEAKRLGSMMHEPSVATLQSMTCISKRSHSPTPHRSHLSQLQQPDFPPPTKDAKLQNAIRVKPATSLYTPTFKHSLHNRFLHAPKNDMPRHKDKGVSFTINPAIVTKEENIDQPITSFHDNSRPFNENINGTFPNDTGITLNNSFDGDSSLEGEIPLGDLSLQEIAELHLSPCSPLFMPQHVNDSYTFLSPTVFCPPPSSRQKASTRISSVASSFADKLVTNELAMTPEQSDEKTDTGLLLQRLQAIKLGMSKTKPVLTRLSVSPEVINTPTHIPNRIQIKLELESPNE